MNKVIVIDDFDTLSEINSKYDLDFSSDEDKDERTVIEEEVREAERRFIEMMQTINPNWTILFISLSKNYIKKDCFQ